VRLHRAPAQQPPQEMLIDPPQTTHAGLRAKLVEHARGWQRPPQAGKSPPCGLFGQLGRQQIEGVGARQHRQQMHPPKLRRTQLMPPPAGEGAWTNLRNGIVRHVWGQKFQQRVSADRRQRIHRDRILTGNDPSVTPT
jgi:hypothetical protein